MDTVTISLRKYHQYLDYEKFVNEQDLVFIHGIGITSLVSKDKALSISNDKNKELLKEVEQLKEKVNDKTLREQLEGKASQEAFLNEKIRLLENEVTELRSTIKRYKDASFLDKLKGLLSNA